MHILTTMFSDEGIQKFSSAATDEVAKGQAAKHQLGMSLYTSGLALADFFFEPNFRGENCVPVCYFQEGNGTAK
jgi:hypothetical protein